MCLVINAWTDADADDDADDDGVERIMVSRHQTGDSKEEVLLLE